MVHLFTEEISVHFVCIREHTQPDSRQRGNGSVVCIARTRKLKKNAAYILKSVNSPAEKQKSVKRVSPYEYGSLELFPPSPPPHYCSPAVLTAWYAELLSRLWLLITQTIYCSYGNWILLAVFFFPNVRHWNFS
jgi:hypothetical protein